MASQNQPKYQLPLWMMMLTGGVAGSIAEVFTIPLDSAQVRLQIQGEGAKIYTGLGDCLMKMFKQEGFQAPFAGLSAGLQRQMVFASLRIGLYEPVREMVCGKDLKGDPPLLKKILAAMITGTIGISVASPTDLVKVRFQGDRRLPAEQRRYTGVINAYSQIIQQQGVVGLWTGLLPNIVRNSVFNAAELASFDQYKQMLLNSGLMVDNIYCHLVASSGAGLTAAIIGSPVDVVKTRIMMASQGAGPQYSGVLDCIVQTLKNEGPLAFYKGFIPNASRVVSWNIVMFVSLGQIRNHIGLNYYRTDN